MRLVSARHREGVAAPRGVRTIHVRFWNDSLFRIDLILVLEDFIGNMTDDVIYF